MKNREGLKTIATAVEHWLMTNASLEVEKVSELKEFITNLDKPRDFKSADGTILRITGKSDHDVSITANADIAMPKLTADTRSLLKKLLGESDGK